MNEPNTQSGQESQQPQRMSSRATNFLIMGAKSGQTNHYQETPVQAATNESQPLPPPPPVSSSVNEAEYPPQKKTGVISSTIYPAHRQNTSEPPSPPSQQSAAQTSQLQQTPSISKDKQAAHENKSRSQEDKIDRLADRITDVLKKISDIKTGMLNPEVRTGAKIQLMAEKSPAFSKFLAVMLTQLEPLLLLVQSINQKLVEKNLIKKQQQAEPNAEADETEANSPPPPPEKISFLELAEKNIIFCDNRKRPLYSLEQMRGKHGGYTASEAVLAPMILEEITKAFHEVAPKAKAIPTPTSGIYANIPMDQVMEQISDEEIMRFLNYVQRFPRGYVGKSFRITESFAGWVVSGTPDD